MAESKKTITLLMEETITELLKIGLRPSTVWHHYNDVYSPIRKYFREKTGSEEYDEKIMTEYICKVEKRYKDKEIGSKYFNILHKAATRMKELYETGRITWSYKTPLKKYKLNEYFQKVLDSFLSSREFHWNTKCDYDWVMRKYLAYLQNVGHNDIYSVKVQDISNFIYEISKTLKAGSLNNVISYLKNFHEYLEETGKLTIPYKGILSFRATREIKIHPPVTQNEVRNILDQIDTATEIGKRDMAIILLGISGGLRAIDIINLKLKDIKWRTNEIHIVQQKTDETLSLPLFEKTGEAIKEYILCARPECESEYIFLTAKPPYRKFNDNAGLKDMWEKYQKKAGIKRKPFDGKGFHSLRRMLGKHMTIAGIPITTIAQVLGHSDIDSAKQYISLDSEHLKECALDFNGIEVGRDELI